MRNQVLFTGEEAAAMIADNATVATTRHDPRWSASRNQFSKTIEQRFLVDRKVPRGRDSGPFLRARATETGVVQHFVP